MSHVRQQIREKVVQVLTGLTTTGSRVYVGRTRPLEAGHEPTLLIYTTPAQAGGQESAQTINMDYPRTLRRQMTLAIEGRVQENEPCDDLLDDIAAEVETAMSDPRLGKLVKDCIYQSTVSQVDASGTRHEGAIRITYLVTYFTKEAAPAASV